MSQKDFRESLKFAMNILVYVQFGKDNFRYARVEFAEMMKCFDHARLSMGDDCIDARFDGVNLYIGGCL